MGQSKIDVLDHGFVGYINHLGDDRTVVNSARVSFNKSVDVISEKDEKLIKYLAKHKHWTPFAHPQITLHMKAPIFVARQLFKHKVGFTENEVSRRYVKDVPQFYMPSHFRSRPENMKQGSTDDPCQMGNAAATTVYLDAMNTAYQAYFDLLEGGVAPEIARGVLPQCTYTEWYWTGSLSAFARVYQQRSHDGAQFESMKYAQAIGEILKPLFPLSWKALTGYYDVCEPSC